jgi:hypothetical protein
LGKFAHKTAAVAALISVVATTAAGLLAVQTAQAQVDPFASIPVPQARPPASPPGGPGAGVGATASAAAPRPAQPNRTGFTGVETAVGRSYAGAQTSGFASTAQIRTLPKYAPPLTLSCKVNTGKVLNARPKLAIPTYAVALVRQGSIRASAMGQGSDIQQRATSISTVLIGVDDAVGAQIAEAGYADLVKRLRVAGYDVVDAAALQASREIGRLSLVGLQTKGTNDWFVYAPKAAPLREGHPFSKAVLGGSKASIVLNDVSADEDAIIVTPQLVLDYARYETTGNSKYTGSAAAGMELRFRLSQSGAIFENGAVKGKGGGFGGSLMCDPTGTDEPFAVMFEIDDKSDDVGIHNAFAQLGLGSLYRQSKYYGVEAVPERYAALARAAYEGFNSTLVAEIQKARGKG